MHVLILHNAVTRESPADARDILDQMEAVRSALVSLGHQVTSLDVDLRLDRALASVRESAPDVIFNLVEAIEDSGQLVPLATGLLDFLGVPYTGTPTEGLVLTSHKILTKRWLRSAGIATPDWWEPGDAVPAGPGPWIVKPLWEDASIGMDDDSVVADFSLVAGTLASKAQVRPCRWFAERFVEGREINVALLAGPDGPRVLPIPEIRFEDFPAGKPRIVGYAAKWHEDSFENRHTVRHFLDPRRESALCDALGAVARRCWALFELGGYARVDFRVDEAGRPWVLEINANPCISPDAGFAAALAEAGLEYAEGMAHIIADAVRRTGPPRWSA